MRDRPYRAERQYVFFLVSCLVSPPLSDSDTRYSVPHWPPPLRLSVRVPREHTRVVDGLVRLSFNVTYPSGTFDIDGPHHVRDYRLESRARQDFIIIDPSRRTSIG